MTEFKAILKTELLKKRKLSESTLKTYLSLLHSLQNKLSDKELSIKWYSKNEKEIINHLKKAPRSTRKTVLSGVYVLSGSNVIHQEMLSEAKLANDEYKQNNKNSKQEANWLTQAEVIKVFEVLETKVFDLIKNKKVFNKEDLMLVRDYVLLGLYVKQNPRRALDYSEMKIKNVNKKVDNYILKNEFVFNRYKTAKVYSTQKINIDPVFLKFLKKHWINKLNTTDYLLIDHDNNKMNSNKITKALNSIFGKNISVNMLRHIFVSDKLKDVPAVSKLDELAKSLGHSTKVLLEYNKK